MLSASFPVDLHIANNLRLAAGDLRDAKTLRKFHSRNAAYHAEQAAEKLLLASWCPKTNIHHGQKPIGWMYWPTCSIPTICCGSG